MRPPGARIQHHLLPDKGRVVSIENELLRATFLVDRGCDLIELLYKPEGVDFLWQFHGTKRDKNASRQPLSQTLFLDQYHGGWQELFPHAGAPASYAGVELGFHGEVWGLPWEFEIVREEPEEVAARFWVRTRQLPFLLQRTVSLRPGDAILRYSETVTNESKREMEFMWGHHPAFGPPFLDQTCILEAPAARVQVEGAFCSWPTDPSGKDHSRLILERSDQEVMKYLHELREGWVALTHPTRRIGVALIFDLDVFPYVWLWQEFGYTKGYPWFGQAYVLGVEPQSSLPRAREFGGRLLKLAAGASMETEIKTVVYEAAGVEHISRDGLVTPR